MACDTPARIAIVGAGPVGIEAALYARFLGYEVALFEQGRRLAENIASLPDQSLGRPFVELSSTLGLAAIESHDEQYIPPKADEVVTANEWCDRYLFPLASTDLLEGCLRIESRVVEVRVLASAELEREDDEMAPDRFELQIQTPDDAAAVHRAAIVIDTVGLIDPQSHYYLLGAAAMGVGKKLSFSEGLTQIRVLFGQIGGRETLDLYAGAASLLKKR